MCVHVCVCVRAFVHVYMYVYINAALLELEDVWAGSTHIASFEALAPLSACGEARARAY